MAAVGGGGRWRRPAEVGGGGRRRVEVDARAIFSCGAVVELVVVVQASGSVRGVSIPLFISLFQFIFFQCLNSELNGLHMLCISELIVVLFY